MLPAIDGQEPFDIQHYTTNYMQDALQSVDDLSPADLSTKLTRHFRMLRMWLALMLLGTAPFRAALHEKLHIIILTCCSPGDGKKGREGASTDPLNPRL